MKFLNLGSTDRLIRLFIGLVLVAIPFVVDGIQLTGVSGIICFVGAAIMLVTASVKFCPVYGLFGLSTGPKA